MPSLAVAPLEGRVWINEYLKPSRRLATKYGDVSQIRPERDPAIDSATFDAYHAQAKIDPRPLEAGFGYTGRVLGVGPVILLADETLNACLQWQHRTGQPWPYGGVQTAFNPNTRAFAINAANGAWRWRVEAAYWPTMNHPAAWCVGLLEAGEVPS